MKIQFVEELGTIFALAQNEKYNNRFHEELLYAEIAPFDTGYVVRWNDNFFYHEPHTDVESAKQSILQNFSSHVPESNGKQWAK